MKSLLILSVALTPVASWAQKSMVVPRWTATKEGNAQSLTPFGYGRVRSLQHIGVGMLRPQLPVFAKITSIAYRRDTDHMPKTAMSRTDNPFWTLRMCNWSPNVNRISNRYLPNARTFNNAFNELQNVFNTKRIRFPTLPPVISGPAPFQLEFKLDRPFVYLGLGLAIDHFVYEPRNRVSHYFVDAERPKSDFGTTKLFGTSCPKGMNRNYASPSNPGGDPLRLWLFGGPSNSVAIAMIGASKTFFGPVPLPWDLTKLGFPGCSFYTSAEIMLGASTKSTGSAEMAIQIPPDPKLAGVTVYSQWMVVDKRVNPTLPLAFSNAVEITLGKAIGLGGVDAWQLYGVGNLARSAYGFEDPNVVLVTRISYQ